MKIEDEIVFKVTLVSGRRLVLACNQKEAVEWASILSRQASASRMASDWKEK